MITKECVAVLGIDSGRHEFTLVGWSAREARMIATAFIAEGGDITMRRIPRRKLMLALPSSPTSMTRTRSRARRRRA